jgi:hypothetical protein
VPPAWNSKPEEVVMVPTGEQIDQIAQRLHDEYQRQHFPKFTWRKLDEIDEATGHFDRWRESARAYVATVARQMQRVQ